MAAGRKRKSKAVTLPGAGGRIVELVELQDPYEPPGVTAQVVRAVNTGPLEFLLSRGLLQGPADGRDDAEARYVAGSRLSRLYEHAGGRGAGSIDYSRIRVDVSFAYSGTPERQASALSELGHIRDKIGPADYSMLHAVCCEHKALVRWARGQWGVRSGADVYQRFRDGLDGLIQYFGVAVGKNARKIRSTGVYPNYSQG